MALQVLMVWSPVASTASSPTAAPGTSVYNFGLQLFRLGEYYRAITELKRFTLLFPQHQRHGEAQLLIGLAFEHDGLPDDALLHFQRVHRRFPNTDVGMVAALKLGELLFSQQRYAQATDHFEQFLRLYPASPLAPRTTYLLGLSWALEGESGRAQRILNMLPAQHALTPQAQALSQAVGAGPPPERVSPRTAGLLAGLLPGAGHLYIGKPVQALTAFILNGLFITGAVLSFREHLIATGAILTYFEIGWYLGNIKSAADGAREINRQTRRAYQDALRSTYALPPLTLDHLQAPGIGLHLSF
jgi:TolA-binding protein